MITQSELKEILDYNPETGVFTWIKNVAYNIKKGKIAGSLNKKGYIIIQINKKLYQAHRLAWLYVYNEWPDIIDHVHGKEKGNMINNLRNVTQRENSQNTYKHRSGKLVGCCYAKHAKKWMAYVTINGKNKHLGYFNTEEEANNEHLRYIKNS